MGSMILFSENPELIKDRVAGGIDALSELEHVELDRLTTLDFEMAVRRLKGVRWAGHPDSWIESSL